MNQFTEIGFDNQVAFAVDASSFNVLILESDISGVTAGLHDPIVKDLATTVIHR
jgi:hypothetical protein